MNPTEMITETAPLTEREQKIEALAERCRTSRDVDVEALIELTDLLPSTDGEPLESPWHFAAIALMKEILTWYWRGRDDFFVGGNMFVYYRIDRLTRPRFRGPDFFYVSGVDGRKHRDKWTFWVEGKSPDLIVEFLSPSTADLDRTTKKDLYAQEWKTAEYFCYDPDLGELQGWRLDPDRGYQPIPFDERGWMWSTQLQLWLGKWTGEFQGIEATWLRLYDEEGKRVLLIGEEATLQAQAEHERAEVERKRAEDERKRADDQQKAAAIERQRAETAEQELTRIKQELALLKARLTDQAPSGDDSSS